MPIIKIVDGKVAVDTSQMREQGERLIDLIDEFAKANNIDVLDMAIIMDGVATSYKRVVTKKMEEFKEELQGEL